MKAFSDEGFTNNEDVSSDDGLTGDEKILTDDSLVDEGLVGVGFISQLRLSVRCRWPGRREL